jgi:hypothetical protein
VNGSYVNPQGEFPEYARGLLTALRDCMAHDDEWVAADTVSRRLGAFSGANAIGRSLSRLAARGACERAWAGDSWRRVGPLPPAPPRDPRPIGARLLDDTHER